MKNKTIAYIRVSTDKQTSENQRNEISRYATDKKLTIDDWFDFEVSSRKTEEQRGITQLLESLNEGDTLIVSELSRLGRSTVGVLTLIDRLNEKGVTTILLRQNLTLSKNSKDLASKMIVTLFSMFGELERDIISERTKEALASRKGKGILGHKFGAFLPSKYDVYENSIFDYRDNANISFEKICKLIDPVGSLGFKAQSLRTWFNKRYEKNKDFDIYQRTKAYEKHIAND